MVRARLHCYNAVIPVTLWRTYLQILKPAEKKAKYQYGGLNSGRPITPPRNQQPNKKGRK